MTGDAECGTSSADWDKQIPVCYSSFEGVSLAACPLPFSVQGSAYDLQSRIRSGTRVSEGLSPYIFLLGHYDLVKVCCVSLLSPHPRPAGITHSSVSVIGKIFIYWISMPPSLLFYSVHGPPFLSMFAMCHPFNVKQKLFWWFCLLSPHPPLLCTQLGCLLRPFQHICRVKNIEIALTLLLSFLSSSAATIVC